MTHQQHCLCQQRPGAGHHSGGRPGSRAAACHLVAAAGVAAAGDAAGRQEAKVSRIWAGITLLPMMCLLLLLAMML